jgi:hypothetical protein
VLADLYDTPLPVIPDHQSIRRCDPAGRDRATYSGGKNKGFDTQGAAKRLSGPVASEPHHRGPGTD